MLKKIISFLFFFLFVFIGKTFAVSIPVEQVFSDITKNYEYYNELQLLYDKGMIFPDLDGKFNPNKLLNRDEFVGIMMEVSCSKCISPNVSYDFFKKYNESQLFFDINKTNKYFYCIAGADDNGYVKGYDQGTKCENGISKEGERPFCPNNTIILEEALAIILRASGILTNSQADLIRNKILSGEITNNLSDDVTPKNLDGTVYSFYPDFQKALDYELVEYDKFGNEKIYKMLEIDDGKIRPKNPIKKEDFLRIAYIALKSNSCNLKKEENLGLEMQILNKTCNENNKNTCQRSSLVGSEKIFDFHGNVSLPLGDSITGQDGYIWRFYNKNTGEEIKKYGNYIDNYDFLVDGDYRVFLRVVSDSGKTAEVYNDINISTQNSKENNKLSIKATPISGNSPLVVDFSSIFSGNNSSSSFFWDFGDGTSSYGNNNTHIYKEQGIYVVTLTVRDQNGEVYQSKVVINVYDKLPGDTDGDGVLDEIDNQINTPPDKILYICTQEDISKKLYNCLTEDTLGVYSEDKKSKDTDGDGVLDDIDNQINTPPDKILYICTQEDISKKLYNCLTEDTLGVYSEDKENVLVGDYDNDGINDLNDLCPTVKGLEKNKGCPIFDDLCSLDKDCSDGYYCNSGVCNPKQTVINCEYTGGDLILGNVVCNSCPCNNFVDFNASLRKCDMVFPAIVSPDKSTIYSKGRFFQVK